MLEGNRNLYWRLTARENLLYFAGNHGQGGPAVRQKIELLLERFSLLDKGDELVSNLSRGMQQKLAIAVAFLADSEVILLDEPTLGLDVETGYEVRELLRGIAAEGRREFTVNLEHAGDIYRLTSLLEREDAPLEGIDRRTINFEQVFRQLIHNGLTVPATAEAQHAA